MGTDFQRTLLWVLFGMSLFMLWDRWLLYTGRPSMFGAAPPAQTAPATPASPAAPRDRAAEGVPAPATPPAAAPDIPQASLPAPAAVPDAIAAPPAGAPVAARTPPVVIETDLLRVAIDLEGAVLSRVELLEQRVAPDWTARGVVGMVTRRKHDPNARVVLLDVSPNRVYVAQSGVIGGDFPNHRTPFTLVDGPRQIDGRTEVTFAAERGGLRVNKTYVFQRGSYHAEVRHELINVGSVPLTPSVYLQMMRDGNKPEGESALYYTYTGPVVYTEQEHFKKVDFSSIERGRAEHPRSADNGWIGMIQHYFVTAWVPPAGVVREFYTRAVDRNLYAIGNILPIAALAPEQRALSESRLYVGPQDQDQLAALAPGLDLVVDYGWLTMLAKPIYSLLSFLHSLVGNWGWAIVLLTVLIKAAFYPLSAASYRSMARMKEVTPRMMKIREQYGSDKQKMNVAMMELYKTEKINPLGGCLPILVQIPVFIALYWVLLASVEMRNAPWILWVQDLATPDSWLILPLLMMATMWIQFKLNPTPPDPVQAKVMAVMPIIFGVMFFFFQPAWCSTGSPTTFYRSRSSIT
jgi:YidC/Oxa1 family membrane protein insertase